MVFVTFSDEGVRCCNTTIPHGQVEANCQELCLYTCDQGYEAAVASRIIKCGFLGWESYGRYVAENNLCRGNAPIIVFSQRDLGD